VSEVRSTQAGVALGGGAGGGGGGGVTSFNGRTGAVVSASGDYLAALQFSAAAEAASFAAIEGTVHVISAVAADPPIVMTLPAAPTDKAVVGFVFDSSNPFPPATAGLDVDPNGKTIAGNPSVFQFYARFPNGAILLMWSALQDTWVIENWTDFILSQGPTDNPAIMVRRSVAQARRLFPLELTQDNVLVGREAGGDVKQFASNDVGQGGFFGNFSAPYIAASGFGFKDRATFAQGLRTLCHMRSGGPIGGDTTIVPGETLAVAPPAATRVVITLPQSADLLGGEQVEIVNVDPASSGAFVVALGLGNAGVVVAGKGLVASGYYAPNRLCPVVSLQYDATTALWWERSPALDVDNDVPGFLSFALPGGGTVDVPGPAAGFVRFFDLIQVVSNVLAAPLVSVTGFLVDAGAVAWPTGTPSPVLGFAGATSPLGAGEVFRIVNGGGTAGRIGAVFYDVPAANYTLIRMALAAAPAVVIPAAPAGFFSRWAQREAPAFSSATGLALAPRATIYNDDTVGHSAEIFVGGLILNRTNNITATNTLFSWPPYRVPIIADDLSMGLAVAPVTRAPRLLGAYETLPLDV
jgi:hypothetical protein